ncbi:hypothetical protein EZJ49_00445 [Bdellovibrio bacteriovorus]|uniref:hypothetical protein n=1 Tax=Bdellovibrio bacteriovorus TaxID=959 RepID=UPI0021D1544B|nr:hypothetical protein [Bdellovibrio bacteriovorus]UXR64723.1 hypothetical protein EZJ49_00445 [Bdellovibrio bacteriovorus]
MIRGAELTTQTQQGNLFVGLKTHLDSNSIQIMNVQLPIYNPDSPLEILGVLQVNSVAPGMTDVDLLVNFTRVTQIPSLKAERGLPNGTFFPVMGTKTDNWYSIPLSDSRISKLYLNVDLAASKVVLGYALGTDAVSAGIIANLFTGFNSNGITGYGGLYSGVQPGQSGFAIFADVSAILNGPTTPKVFFADSTSESSKRPLQKRLWDLNAKKTWIRVR